MHDIGITSIDIHDNTSNLSRDELESWTLLFFRFHQRIDCEEKLDKNKTKNIINRNEMSVRHDINRY
jgi:hypothetical protein